MYHQRLNGCSLPYFPYHGSPANEAVRLHMSQFRPLKQLCPFKSAEQGGVMLHFLRFSKTGTMLPIKYMLISQVPKIRQIWDIQINFVVVEYLRKYCTFQLLLFLGAHVPQNGQISFCTFSSFLASNNPIEDIPSRRCLKNVCKPNVSLRQVKKQL